MQLDHIAIAGETLEAARAVVEDSLGVSLQPGGEHAVFHTHNRLLGLEEGLYLEAIAINPAAPTPQRPRWFDLDRFNGAPRLTNWICRTKDLDAELSALPPGYGQPVDLRRGDLRWRMAVPETGILPYDNCAPALMQWRSEEHPARLLRPSGVRLKRLTVVHPDARDLEKEISVHFNDARVVFETGTAALHAEFDTPNGVRSLSA